MSINFPRSLKSFVPIPFLPALSIAYIKYGKYLLKSPKIIMLKLKADPAGIIEAWLSGGSITKGFKIKDSVCADTEEGANIFI